MEKEFVPYTLALGLKELGFNEEVEFYKDLSEEIFDMRTPNDAPCILWQQAFRWFREEYNIHGQISVLEDENWHYSVRQKSNNYNINFPEKTRFRTFEEAELACLKALIEIVKEKQL
jgi:hypothetical protein